jgi:hypothetical protein
LLSENLLPEIRKNPILEVVGDARDIEFDGDGNLEPAFELQTHEAHAAH